MSSGYQTLLLYTKICAGASHSIVYHDSGKFYGFGTGQYGELGNKQGFVKFEPLELDLGIKINSSSKDKKPVRVAAGERHSLILADGKVYSFGQSEHGRLGREESEIVVEFPNDDLISFIAAGTSFSVAVSENGYNLYTWGLGRFGAGDVQDGGRSAILKPELFHIVDPRTNARKSAKVVQVSCGNRHTLALCEDGEVYSWGSGEHGRLGHGDVTNHAVPHLIKAFVVNAEQHVVMVAAGDSHSMALSKEGRVYTWGSGSYGRLGLGAEVDHHTPAIISSLRAARAISAGVHHSLAITKPTEGDAYSLFTWGGGKYGKLGLAPYEERVEITSGSEDNQLSPAPVQAFSSAFKLTVINAVCGNKHTIAVTRNEQSEKAVFAWGYAKGFLCGVEPNKGTSWFFPRRLEFFDGKRQLHTSTIVPDDVDDTPKVAAATEVCCGESHSFALCQDGRLMGWGSNAFGQLGAGFQSMSARPIPIPVGRDTRVRQVACGTTFTMCVTEAGDVYSWGSNDDGQLGQGDLKPYLHPTLVQGLQGTFIDQVACGHSHSCAIHPGNKTAQDSNKVFVWGSNADGQLGLGKNAQGVKKQRIPVPLNTVDAQARSFQLCEVSLGHSHTLFLFKNLRPDGRVETSQVYACGAGGSGQLGLEDLVSQFEPKPVDKWAKWDDEDDDGKGRATKAPTIKMISAGARSSTAILEIDKTDHMFIWGAMPGMNSGLPQLTPHFVRVRPDGFIEVLSRELSENKEQGERQAKPVIGLRFCKLASGRTSFFALAQYDSQDPDKKVLFAWGETKYGKLGLGNVGGDNADSDAAAARQRESGARGSTAGGAAKAGDADRIAATSKPRVVRELLTSAICSVATYSDHSLALNKKNVVYAWGYGDSGRLGMSDGSNDSASNKSLVIPTEVPAFRSAGISGLTGITTGHNSDKKWASVGLSASGAAGAANSYGAYGAAGGGMGMGGMGGMGDYKDEKYGFGGAGGMNSGPNGILVGPGGQPVDRDGRPLTGAALQAAMAGGGGQGGMYGPGGGGGGGGGGLMGMMGAVGVGGKPEGRKAQVGSAEAAVRQQEIKVQWKELEAQRLDLFAKYLEQLKKHERHRKLMHKAITDRIGVLASHSNSLTNRKLHELDRDPLKTISRRLRPGKRPPANKFVLLHKMKQPQEIAGHTGTHENPDDVLTMDAEAEPAPERKKFVPISVLTDVEKYLGTVYLAPCRLMTLAKKVQLEIDVFIAKKETKKKSGKKKAAAAGADGQTADSKDEKKKASDGSGGGDILLKESTVKEQIDILKNNFVDILFSLYNTHMPEDRRLLEVFLSMLLAQHAATKSERYFMLPDTLEYACWTQMFEVGKLRLDIRKELEDVIATRTDEVPLALLNVVDKQALIQVLEGICQKARTLAGELISETRVAALVAAMEWPLVLMFDALKRQKRTDNEAIGERLVYIMADILMRMIESKRTAGKSKADCDYLQLALLMIRGSDEFFEHIQKIPTMPQKILDQLKPVYEGKINELSTAKGQFGAAVFKQLNNRPSAVRAMLNNSLYDFSQQLYHDFLVNRHIYKRRVRQITRSAIGRLRQELATTKMAGASLEDDGNFAILNYRLDPFHSDRTADPIAQCSHCVDCNLWHPISERVQVQKKKSPVGGFEDRKDKTKELRLTAEQCYLLLVVLEDPDFLKISRTVSGNSAWNAIKKELIRKKDKASDKRTDMTEARQYEDANRWLEEILSLNTNMVVYLGASDAPLTRGKALEPPSLMQALGAAIKAEEQTREREERMVKALRELVGEITDTTQAVEPTIIKPIVESLTALGKEEVDPAILASFKGADRRRYNELARINKPQPVKSAEPKGRVHRFSYREMVERAIMLPIMKDPKRGSPLPWCWFANCACLYSEGYAQFCANLKFEFITSPKSKLDQILMKGIYMAGTQESDGDLLFEDILSIAVLEAQVNKKQDVTYVIRYNYFGDRVPITVAPPTESEKTKEQDALSLGLVTGASGDKAPEILLVFKCADLKELLEELRPQQGEFEFDTAKGKANEMLGKFTTDKKVNQ